MLRLSCLLALAGVASAAPVPKDTAPTGLIVFASGYDGVPLRLFSPAGGAARELPLKEVCWGGTLSPDRTRLAYFLADKPPPRDPKADPFTSPAPKFSLHLLPLDGGDKPKPSVAGGFGRSAAVWMPDGKTLLVSDHSKEVKKKMGGALYLPGDVSACDPATGKVSAIPALSGHRIEEVSPDGKRLLAVRESLTPDETVKSEQVALDFATGKTMPLGEYPSGSRGRLVARPVEPDPKAAVSSAFEYSLVDPKTKAEARVNLPSEIGGDDARLSRVLLSPDGRHLLFVWLERVPAPDDWVPKDFPCMATRLTVTNRDGTNAKTIYRPEVKTRLDQLRTHFFWIAWQ